MSDADQLKALRVRIDSLDEKILELISERARCAQDVARVKMASLPEGEKPVFYRPEREAWVLKHIMELNKGPLDNEEMARLFREIMSSCLALEQPLKVAYLGPAGTYTEQAMFKQFGHAIVGVDCVSIDDIFHAVEADGATFGVVPIENSIEGAINRTMDLLLNSPLRICAEVSLAIRHSLMHRTGDMAQVTTIVAHPQALAQCYGWLKQHYPNIEQKPVSSNAQGARMAQESDAIACIAGDSAAMMYELQKVAVGIQDDANNRTRFVVLGKQVCSPSPADKTSLILAAPNKAGSVFELIEPLARHGVSMVRFESRPAKQKGWEYYFYIDFIGHTEQDNVAKALAEIEAQAAFYKCLGSYPVTV